MREGKLKSNTKDSYIDRKKKRRGDRSSIGK